MKSPKIILDIRSQQWVLKTLDGYWSVPFASDATNLAGYIPLDVLDTTITPAELFIQGEAYLYSTEGTSCIVELIRKNPDDKVKYITDLDNFEYVENITKKRQIKINYCLNQYHDSGKLDFCYGFTNEGDKLANDAVILLKNVKVIGLRVGISEEMIPMPKMTSFQIDGEIKHNCELTIENTEEIWINIENFNELGNELRIISSFEESDQNESNKFGLNLLELNINFTRWEPYRAIYDKHNKA